MTEAFHDDELVPNPPPPVGDEEKVEMRRTARLAHPGGDWLLSAPDKIPALWGQGHEVVWPEGETLILMGGDGSGKTILAGNLLMRQLGVINTPLLGLPVAPRSRVLYLAQDRPKQAQRSFKRLIGGLDRDVLNDRLVVVDWQIGMVDENPELLAELVVGQEADTLYVDSLKDICSEPSSEKSGLAVKRAYSMAIEAGAETCLLHHDRKVAGDSKRNILKLADVYGSRFITAGAGSVIALNGGSGDPVINIRTLKQADEEFGPLGMLLDFASGDVSVHTGTDLLSIVRNSPQGLSPLEAARLSYETDTPTPAEKQRARRALQRLHKRELLHLKKGDTANEADRYIAVTQTVAFSETPAAEEVYG
jgi:replicative DNA helicase